MYRSHKRIFELVNIVADDRYGVVSELRESSVLGERTQIELYLEEVKNAVVAGLELGGSDPFYGIAKEDNSHGTRR
jgi:nuclear pore complex protein Nup107